MGEGNVALRHEFVEGDDALLREMDQVADDHSGLMVSKQLSELQERLQALPATLFEVANNPLGTAFANFRQAVEKEFPLFLTANVNSELSKNDIAKIGKLHQAVIQTVNLYEMSEVKNAIAMHGSESLAKEAVAPVQIESFDLDVYEEKEAAEPAKIESFDLDAYKKLAKDFKNSKVGSAIFAVAGAVLTVLGVTCFIAGAVPALTHIGVGLSVLGLTSLLISGRLFFNKPPVQKAMDSIATQVDGMKPKTA